MTPRTLTTHSGDFHADDIFATATLQIWLDQKGESYTVTRTRDEEVINTSDFVYDVGGVHDHSKKRYDHHQVGRAGERPNGIPYAAFGLIWKYYGLDLCAGNEDSWNRIDERIVQPIDANDNGVPLVKELYTDISPLSISGFLAAFRPNWSEQDTFDTDAAFLDMVALAKKYILRILENAAANALAAQKVEEAYAAAPDKRIIIVDQSYPFYEVLAQYPEPLFVIYPKNDSWRAKNVRIDPREFTGRTRFPQQWGGLRGEELSKTLDIPGLQFVHTAGFLGVADSKEGILALVEKSLQENPPISQNTLL